MHKGKSRGGLVSGTKALKNKTGIHSLTREQIKLNSAEGKRRFLWKYKNISEFRELHSQKIRYGRIKKKFDKLRFEQLDSKTLFIL